MTKQLEALIADYRRRIMRNSSELGTVVVGSLGLQEIIQALEQAYKRNAELEANSKAEHELFLRAKALMYCSGGTPIERSLNPIDAWLYDAEHAAGGQVEGD